MYKLSMKWDFRGLLGWIILIKGCGLKKLKLALLYLLESPPFTGAILIYLFVFLVVIF